MSYEGWIQRRDKSDSLFSSPAPNSQYYDLVSQEYGSIFRKDTSPELRMAICRPDTAPAAQPVEYFQVVSDLSEEEHGEESENNPECQPLIFDLVRTIRKYNFLLAITVTRDDDVSIIEEALKDNLLSAKFEYCGYTDRTVYYGSTTNHKLKFANKMIQAAIGFCSVDCTSQCIEMNFRKPRRYRRKLTRSPSTEGNAM